MIIRKFLFVFLTLKAAAITPDEIERLVTRSPSPLASSIQVMCSRGHTVVAATAQAEIAVSHNDGISWSRTISLSSTFGETIRSLNITGLAASPDIWLALTREGRFVRSSNLENWDLQTNAPSLATDLVYGENLFLTTTSNGRISYSENNGDLWTDATLPVTGARLESITYGNGLFVAVGAQTLLVSEDGATWTQRNLVIENGQSFRQINFVNGNFVASGLGGLLYTSTNGENWMHQDLKSPLSLVGPAIEEPAGKTSILSGNKLIQLTSVPDPFIEVNLPTSFNTIIKTDSGSLIAGGLKGRLQRKANESNDWVNVVERRSDNFDSVALGNGIFVALDNGEGRIFTSADGITWSLRGINVNGYHSDIIFNGTIFAMIADDGRAYWSNDGINWDSDESNLGRLKNLRYLNGKWLAFRPWGDLAESTDLISWTFHEISETPPIINAINYGEGLYVAVGRNVIFTSPDLLTWTPRTVENSTIPDFLNVEYGNGRFLALGARGATTLSEDGITWQALTNTNAISGSSNTGYDDELGFYSLDFSSRVVYWPGDSTLDDPAIDGAFYPTSLRVTGIAEGNGTVVIVGRDGLLMSLPRTSSSYQEWVTENFGAGVGDSLAGIQADPDTDGLLNLEEYARGTNPTLPSPSLPLVLSQNGGLYTAEFSQRSGLSDLRSALEYSTDLESWSNEGLLLNTVDFGDGTESIRAQLSRNPATTPKFFFRVVWSFSQ